MLSVQNISFGYSKKRILNQVSFDLQPGEAKQICGHNGVGKSTLLKICAGLISANSGEVSHSESHQNEYLPADKNGLFLHLDARENLKFWQQNNLKSSKPMDAALEKFGLTKAADARLSVRFFSSGMKRRLALAVVYLSPKKVWILDEPVSNIDTQGIELFQHIANEHLSKNGSILFVSHSKVDLNSHTKIVLNSIK